MNNLRVARLLGRDDLPEPLAELVRLVQAFNGGQIARVTLRVAAVFELWVNLDAP